MSRFATLLVVVVTALTYFVAVVAQARIDETRDALQEDLLYLPNEQLLNHFTGGLDTVIADLLWLQCVQYTGTQVKGDRDFRWLDQMIRTVIRLDPQFVDAYRYGAMFLATVSGDDEGALDLLAQGFLMTPDSYVMPYEMGMIYLLNRRDEPGSRAAAAQFFAVAVRRDDSPDFLPVLLSGLSDEANLEGFEKDMWLQRLEMAEKRGDKVIADLARRKLSEIQTRATLELLRAGVNTYAARTGQPPESFEALLEAGVIPQRMYDALRNDGLGGRYILDAHGEAQSSALLDDEKQTRLNSLRNALDAYHTAQGAWPLSLQALVDAGKLSALPEHPYAGASWRYNPADGSVR